MAHDNQPKPLRTNVLFIANSNFLQCSALAELLATDVTLQNIDDKNIAIRSFPDIEQTCRFDQRYDLVIVFTICPVSTLPALISRIRGSDTKVLLVLDASDEFAIHHLTRIAVDGIVSAAEAVSEFRQAVRTLVLDGKKYISPRLAAELIDPHSANATLSSLSKKEQDVAKFIANGKRNVDIARSLNISPKTVNTYKSRIYKKLNVDNDCQLLRLTIDHGFPYSSGAFIEDGSNRR